MSRLHDQPKWVRDDMEKMMQGYLFTHEWQPPLDPPLANMGGQPPLLGSPDGRMNKMHGDVRFSPPGARLFPIGGTGWPAAVEIGVHPDGVQLHSPLRAPSRAPPERPRSAVSARSPLSSRVARDNARSPSGFGRPPDAALRVRGASPPDAALRVRGASPPDAALRVRGASPQPSPVRRAPAIGAQNGAQNGAGPSGETEQEADMRMSAAADMSAVSSSLASSSTDKPFLTAHICAAASDPRPYKDSYEYGGAVETDAEAEALEAALSGAQ